MDSKIVEALPLTRKLKCEEIGATCHESSTEVFSFVTNPLATSNPSTLQISQVSLASQAPIGDLPNALSASEMVIDPNDPDGSIWRKKLKGWASIPKYSGKPSLVLLKGWELALTEAFRRTRVAKGREQVLAASYFLKGEAAD